MAEVQIEKAEFNLKGFRADAIRFANDLTSLYTNNLKIALVRKRKVARGITLRGVANRTVGGSSTFGEKMILRRQVIAPKSLQYIQEGRKPGGKMPAIVGGKGQVLPRRELMLWLLANRIPRSAWFPIMKRIAKRGIKPTPVIQYMMRESKPRFRELCDALQRTISKHVIVKTR